MNWFEHHINDYDEATSHLSSREDGIYHRLIRKYYAKEKPLPANVAKLQRWCRCRDDEDRQAVVEVLEEFFELREDGYHQKTCDEVLAAYHAGAPQRELNAQLKKANEETRTTRHRQERSRLFQALQAFQVHAPWNIKMPALRALVAKLQSEKDQPATASAAPPATPVTAPATPATQPATATATPVTATHLPPPTTQSEGSSAASDDASATQAVSTTKAERGKRLPKDWVLPMPWGQWAIEAYPHWDASVVRQIALTFANHFQSTTKNPTRLDWFKTWQNWCIDVKTQRQHPAPRDGASTAETSFQRARRASVSAIDPSIASKTPQQGRAQLDLVQEVTDVPARIRG